MNIQTSDALGLFRKNLIAVYQSKIQPSKFLGSFFKENISDGLEVSIGVERDSEKIAVDVVRGTDGNRNIFSNTTEKIFIPPYYREYFDITNLDFYDRLWKASSISDTAFAQLVYSGARKMEALQAKIDRTYELQRAQILQTGVLLYDQGMIDFKRKAASLVDPGAGNYFAGASVNPFAMFEAGATFLRTQGKAGGAVINAIMGSQAFTDLMNNAAFKERQNYFSMKLDNVHPPQRDSQGAVLMGSVSAGSYQINIWTYPQYYDLAGVSTPYIDPKKVIMIPENPDFVMAYAATPQLLEPGQAPETGAFIFTEFTDEKRRTREYHVESAGMPIPVAIDQIYTFKAVA